MSALDRLESLAARAGGKEQAAMLRRAVQSAIEGKTKRCIECDESMPYAFTTGHRHRGRWFCSSSCAGAWDATAKPYLQCPPELGDGFGWFLLEAGRSNAAMDTVNTYLQDDPQDGEEFTIRCVFMSDAEVARLPEL